ncbi:Protein of unknown function [Mariniphaga anaerophila]|uniref:DUF3823 domain-containing protein n=1 Tax=Mariniphaga anaerophila TaxID=1484053 RepID=A0A1M5EMK7_9BACT|nr:DUF3823 domain-containing protein [Mariniphaga anaerophila]SHF80435.1 Protein of unknown function [Mariniphaga anaerophila]
MKIHKLILGLLILLTACQVDNYDEPNHTLTGTLKVKGSDENFVSEQPNAYRIKLLETSWSDNPEPQYFWGKADGTFRNTRLFAATYKVQPVEGAFFPVDAVETEIKGTKNIDFTVIPYLEFENVDITKSGNSLNVSYRLKRQQAGDKIIDTRVFISKNPSVGNNVFSSEISPMVDLQNISDEEILQTTFNESISNFESNSIYYVRIGARTDNAQKRYNFTKIVKIEM